MGNNNFNEELKRQESENSKVDNSEEMALDSLARVKVLSPGRLVFNRFIRNKLAIIGSVVLIIMFIFAFVCPLFYPYSQTQIFYKYDEVRVDYAQAATRSDFTTYLLFEDASLPMEIENNLNSISRTMESEGTLETTTTDADGNLYIVKKETDHIYGLYADMQEEVANISGAEKVADYNAILKSLDFSGEAFDADFKDAVERAVSSGKTSFSYQDMDFEVVEGRKQTYVVNKVVREFTYTGASFGETFETEVLSNLDNESFVFEGTEYTLSVDGSGAISVKARLKSALTAYMSTYVFDAFSDVAVITDGFKVGALTGLAKGEDFMSDGVTYSLAEDEDQILVYAQDAEEPTSVFSTLAIRAYDGTDSLDIEYKEQLHNVILKMTEEKSLSDSFVWEIPQFDENGQYELDADGNRILQETEMYVSDKNGSYVVSCDKVSYLIDIFATSSSDHWFGTDGDGMDILSRMMYGGRVSLLVCFVVIIIENIIGIIMGGIAGFFGGWVDNVIMRMVDIFYCIPSLPILIIIGALFDQIKLDPYIRMIWLMVVLGVLGWAGVARLVRGQILSLREQEFMVAAEATGVRTSRRIFKHLVPNVMPQIIVTASSGLGSIIITESTLSFLGLGVKHPLATWGTMINSVTKSSEMMIKYAYIWVPVGMLICLTVIAFNFVGDGLRDAFDPKMKQ